MLVNSCEEYRAHAMVINLYSYGDIMGYELFLGNIVIFMVYTLGDTQVSQLCRLMGHISFIVGN